MSSLKNGNILLLWWERLRGLGGLGRWCFSRAVGCFVPYSGSIKAQVLELARGHVRVGLQERRAIRNHLGSIHAIALANLCELTSGLAMLTTLPVTMRGIVTGFSIQYFKKARGYIIAESRCAVPEASGEHELTVQVEARDSSGAVVCSAQAYWKIGSRG